MEIGATGSLIQDQNKMVEDTSSTSADLKLNELTNKLFVSSEAELINSMETFIEKYSDHENGSFKVKLYNKFSGDYVTVVAMNFQNIAGVGNVEIEKECILGDQFIPSFSGNHITDIVNTGKSADKSKIEIQYFRNISRNQKVVVIKKIDEQLSQIKKELESFFYKHRSKLSKNDVDLNINKFSQEEFKRAVKMFSEHLSLTDFQKALINCDSGDELLRVVGEYLGEEDRWILENEIANVMAPKFKNYSILEPVVRKFNDAVRQTFASKAANDPKVKKPVTTSIAKFNPQPTDVAMATAWQHRKLIVAIMALFFAVVINSLNKF